MKRKFLFLFFVMCGIFSPVLTAALPLLYNSNYSQTDSSMLIRTLVYHQITSFTEQPVSGQGWQHVISDNGNKVVWYTQPNPKRVYVANSDGSNIQELANMGSDRLTAVDISSDGSMVVYIGGPFASGHQLNSVNSDGSNDQVLITLTTLSIQTLRISGDGSKIFFNVTSNTQISGSGDPIEKGLYSINPDGSGLEQIAGAGDVAALMGIALEEVGQFGSSTGTPVLDPSFDASKLIFVAKNGVTGEENVFTVNNGATQLIFGPIKYVDGVGVSRDGQKVAFRVLRDDGIYEGYIAGFDGSGMNKIASNEQFTFTGSNSSYDQVSLLSDGSMVLFGSYGHLFNSDGSEVIQLSANTAAPAGLPLIVGSLTRVTMSSDGSRILFSFAGPGGIWQLATLDINPSGLGEAPELTDIILDPSYTVLTPSSGAGAYVKINTANTVDYVGNAILLNGILDSKVTNRTFYDDGATAGDEVAGDFIYTHNNIVAYQDAVVGPRIIRINSEVFSGDGRLHGTSVDLTPFEVLQDPPVSVDEEEYLLNTYLLKQNYPNPFNPTTRISWQAPVSSWQTLKVFDVLGKEVATLVNGYKPAGNYEIEFDASSLLSGVYFYKLTAGTFTSTKKMIVLR